MFIPYTTDAPLYHRPIGTIATIAANFVAFIATSRSPFEVDPNLIEPYVLHHDAIVPLQWVTSNFLHIDLMHLLGNMLFLWVFGLVVEGKLGWWRFVPLYVAIGTIQCAAEQFIAVAVNAGGFSLGASSAIYGLMGLSLIWAPTNEIYCVWWGRFSGLSHFEVSIQLMCVLFAGVDFLLAWSIGFRLATPVYHLMGLVPGLILGVVLLKLHVVDGEGWDIFSIIAGREGAVKVDLEETSPGEDDAQRLIVAKRLMNEHLTVGNCEAALELHLRMAARLSEWRLTEPMQQQLIALMLTRGETKVAKPLLADYIKRFPGEAAPMRVALAELVLREESRPGQAIAILSHIPPGALSGELERRRNEIHKEAYARRDAGEIEVLGDLA
jgi:membrane associated rhomboid family serine protease